jgi:RNA polymerase sigma factor (sigma-70 family)
VIEPTRRLLRLPEYFAYLYARGRRRRGLADDIRAACVVALAQGLATFDPARHPKGKAGLDSWCYRGCCRVAIRLLRDFLRRPPPQQLRRPEAVKAPPVDLDAPLDAEAACRKVRAAVPPRRWQAMWLYWGLGRTYEQAGREMRLTRERVRQLCESGRRKVRQALGEGP